MKQKYPKKNITFSPQSLRAVELYAKERGIGRSTAVQELILYVILGDESEINPKVVEKVARQVREQLSGVGFA